MTTLKTVIVDDERLARRGLALRLQDIPHIEVIAECANAQDALQSIARHSPDLIFLDIQMPGMSGFEMLCELQADTMPMIIFVTAFDQYAVEAFNIHAVDYVLKPIDEDRLCEAVGRAVERHALQDSSRTKQTLMELMDGLGGGAVAAQVEQSQPRSAHWPERLTIKDGSEFQFVRMDDIRWIDAAGDYMCVHASGKTHIMRTTMKQLEGALNPEVFLRVHRSSIVNLNYITAAQIFANGEYQLTLEGDAQIKVSRGYGHRIKSLLGD